MLILDLGVEYLVLISSRSLKIDKINTEFLWLLPPGGLVSPPGIFASLVVEQENSQRHLADRNAICILH